MTVSFAAVRSHRAVTLGSNGKNLNRGSDGRYLEIDACNDDTKEFAVGFDTDEIIDALKGIDREDLLSAELYLWNEAGRISSLAVSAFDSPFNENTVVSADTLSGFGPPTTVSLTDDIGWKALPLPRSLLLAWLDAPGTSRSLLVEATQPHTCLRCSSDETRRPPTLIVRYRNRKLTPSVTPNDLLATETDNERCRIEIDAPDALRVGETYSITLRARDNVMLDYYTFSLFRDDGGTLASDRTEGYIATSHADNRIVLSGRVNDDTPGAKGHLILKATADDVSGLAPRCRAQIRIPIGDNDRPLIAAQTRFEEIPEVRPAFYRLIRNDGQKVRIVATASDTDGIDHMELKIDGRPSPVRVEGNRIDHTWVNLRPGTQRFRYTVTAVDRTGIASTCESEAVPIRDWNELRLYNRALTFSNFGEPAGAGRQYLDYTYGRSEVRGRRGNYTIRSRLWYPAVRDLPVEGNCYGMSATAVALATGRESLTAENLQPGAVRPADVTDTPEVRRFILAKHISQVSRKAFERLIDCLETFSGDPVRSLHAILNDLDGTFSHYGSLNITEGHAGHSLVPWMARRYRNGDWKVYVYDSNKIDAVDAIQNRRGDPRFDLDRMFPAVDFNLSLGSWRYDINSSGGIWNDTLCYYPYSILFGNQDLNPVDRANGLFIHDHALPTALQNAALYLVKGDVTVEIPDTAARANGAKRPVRLPLLDVDPARVRLFASTGDEPVVLHIRGEGKYTLDFFKGHLHTTIADKQASLQPGDTVEITFDPGNKEAQVLRFTSGIPDSGFVVSTDFLYAKTKDGSVVNAAKTYRISSMPLEAGKPVDFSLRRYAEYLGVSSAQQSPLTFELTVDESDGGFKPFTVYRGKVFPVVRKGIQRYGFDLSKRR